MSDWRPIETAPKDGTNILVWAEGYDWPESVRYEFFDAREAKEVGQPGYWRYSEDLLSDYFVMEFGNFTHWAPINPPTTPEIA